MRGAAVAVLTLFLFSCAGAPRFSPLPGEAPAVRVLVAEDEGSLKVSCAGPFCIKGGGQVLARFSPGQGIELSSRSGALILLRSDGSQTPLPSSVFVVPQSASPLHLEGVAYPGSLQVRRGAAGLEVVNSVGLEDYLEGVVGLEMGAVSPEEYEALQAQAIAARTYSLQMKEKRKGGSFDLYATVKDQVYRGLVGRDPLASAAVRDTRGMILTYRGDLVRTYYCANCGGHTADISQVWPDREAFPYLHGVRDARRGEGAFCRGGKRFRWRYSFTARELGEMFRRTISSLFSVSPEDVGFLVDVEVRGRDPSGRVRSLVVETTEGRYQVAGDRIRWLFRLDGGRILPSIMFALEKRRVGGRLAFLSIVGGGNGHGVGLCQRGALAMARRGYTYEMILSHYYPGTEIVKKYQ